MDIKKELILLKEILLDKGIEIVLTLEDEENIEKDLLDNGIAFIEDKEDLDIISGLITTNTGILCFDFSVFQESELLKIGDLILDLGFLVLEKGEKVFSRGYWIGLYEGSGATVLRMDDGTTQFIGEEGKLVFSVDKKTSDNLFDEEYNPMLYGDLKGIIRPNMGNIPKINK